MNRIEKLLVNTGDMALKRRAKMLIKNLSVSDGDKVLDVGCGDGFYTHLILNLGKKIELTGTDIDRNALLSARKNLKNNNIRLVYADLMKGLPFRRNTFNKIIMSEVTEHLPDDTVGLKEVYRVLKPKGRLCLSVPNANYPFLWDPVNWIMEHLFGKHIKYGFWSGIWNQHIRLYKPNEITKVVKNAGFRVVNVKSLTWWCLPFNHNLINITARQLYGGKFSPETAKALSKYNFKKPRGNILLDSAFLFLNTLDILNDIWNPKDSGVSVVVIAEK